MALIASKDKGSTRVIAPELVRTMRKDLKRLREADMKKENERILRIPPAPAPDLGPIAEPAALAQPAAAAHEELKTAAATPPAPPQTTGRIIPQEPTFYAPVPHAATAAPGDVPEKKQAAQEPPHPEPRAEEPKTPINASQAKQHATEEEKQKIFLLESQKSDLENQIRATGNKKEPPLAPEKEKLLSRQKDTEAKLSRIIEEEKAAEDAERAIDEKEQAATTPEEKQKIEQERWKAEERRQKAEKNRWTLEQELAKVRKELTGLDSYYQEFSAQEEELRGQIAEIHGALNKMYVAIMEREKAIAAGLKTPRPVTATAPQGARPAPEAVPPKPAPIKETPSPLREKAFLKEAPPEVKETLEKMAAVEDVQRRRFMEDVEAWAKDQRQGVPPGPDESK